MTNTTYTFRVLDPDGAVFGKGCFTYEGPPDGVDLQYNFGTSAGGTANRLVAFWYHDPVAGTRDLSNVINFNFTNGWQGAHYRFDFNVWDFPQNSHGLTAGQAQPGHLGPISGHRGDGDVSNQKKLEFPALAPATVTSGESSGAGGAGQASVPAVDLVVVIDSSTSMKDEAVGLGSAVHAAIEAARSSCPSDLRVTYLGIEGTFKGTPFDRTARSYLTQQCAVAESALRGRKKGEIAGGGGQEDGARNIEDVSAHMDWRPGAARAIFYLGDESLEGGDTGGKQDQDDIAAANRAIEGATRTQVKVHTYYGTSGVKAAVRKEIEQEYARVAKETGGQAFTSQDALSGFQQLLQKVICGSRPAPLTITKPFTCCKESVAS